MTWREHLLFNVKPEENRIKTELVCAWKAYRYFPFSSLFPLFSKFFAIKYFNQDKNKTGLFQKEQRVITILFDTFGISPISCYNHLSYDCTCF
jgi:hypothetical protein